MLSVRSVEVRSSRHRLGLMRKLFQRESGKLPFLHWKNGREITDRITGQRTFDERKNRDNPRFQVENREKFDARVALNRDEAGKVTGLKFDFTDLEPVKVKDVVCPLCGGEIIQTPFGFGCANYSKDNPESCKFAIGTIAGVKLKEAQVKELLPAAKRKSSKVLSQRQA